MPTGGKGSIVRRRGASHPAWDEQRVEQRTDNIEVPVEICARGEWCRATIVDFSAQGIGLVGEVALDLGEVISIAFANGVSILCTVRWCESGRFGVSLNGALRSTLLETFAQPATKAPADGKKH